MMIGVNTDEKSRLKEIIDKNQLTWSSWSDFDMKICKQWNVHLFPTIFLIDAQGRIRQKDPQDSELDTTIEALVAEAEKEQHK